MHECEKNLHIKVKSILDLSPLFYSEGKNALG